MKCCHGIIGLGNLDSGIDQQYEIRWIQWYLNQYNDYAQYKFQRHGRQLIRNDWISIQIEQTIDSKVHTFY